MDNSNLDKKIDKLINAMELLVDAVERGKGDNGYMSNSRFARRIKDGGNDYLYKEFEELGQDDIEGIRNEIISNYQKGIKKANRKFNQLRKDLDKASTQSEKDEIRIKIKETERKKNELKRNKKNISNTDIEDYYNNYVREDSDYQLSKKWKKLGKKEKKHYTDEQDFKNSEREKFKYHQTSNERDEVRRRIANSGLGDTAVGRYGQKMFDRQQRAADLGNFANYLGREGASKIGGMFGKGGLGKGVTAGLGKFAKGLGFASKLMGGPFVQGLLMAIDVLHGVGDAVAEWKKHNAKMIRYQTEYEKITYEHDKQIANLQAEQQTIDIEYDKDVQMKMLDVQGQNLLEATGIQNKQMVNSLNAAIGGMTQGVMQSAYQAASNMVDYQAESLKSARGREVRGKEQERYNAIRAGEYAKDTELNKAERQIVDVEYETAVAKNLLDKEHYLREKVADAADITKNGISISGIAGGVSAAFNTDSTDTATFKENGKGLSWGSSKSNANPVTGTSYSEAGRINNNNGWNTAGTALTGLVMGSNMVKAKNEEESAQLENASQALKQTADWNKQAIENYYKVSLTEQKAQKELYDKEAELAKNLYDQEIDTLAEMRKIWLNVAQEIETYWLDIDKATNKAALNQGILNPKDRTQFQKYLNDVANTIGYAYGKSAVEVAATQSNYSESTGRNKTLSKDDYEKTFYMGTRLGDEGLAAEYSANMEIFNHGVETSVDMLDEALDDVNRIGLNGKKYTKDLVNNLRLAHKYNFKGGTKELMEMAKWAQQTRFNLGSLGSMLDKVQEGGIEGVITQSAGFQVLGGHAAINSDPLGMLYDAFADPQAYAKRMQDMTKGFGRFNKETGETEFNINETMQIAQLAKLQGRSTEELRDEIMQRNKESRVEKQLNEYQKFDEEQKAMITNKAEYKDGRWLVKMKGGDMKDVSQLTKEDLENLMPQGHEERMEDLQKQGVEYLRQIVDYQTKNQGETIREKGLATQKTWEQMQDESNERIKNMMENFDKNFQTNISNIKTAMSEATSSQQDLLSMYKNNAEAMAKKQNDMAVSAGKFSESMDQLSKVINVAVKKISESVNIEHRTPPPTPTEVPKVNNVENNQGITTKRNLSVNLPLHRGEFEDAITSGNGNSMFVSASNVTPVEDGTARIARTNPNDTALFAKNGGPFDRLFNDVFGEINKVYNIVNNSNKVYSPFSMLNTALFNDNRDGSLGGKKTSDYDHKIIKELFTNGDFTKSLYDGYGNYDSESGVTKFSNSDKKELLRIANTEGRDIDDVMNEIARRNYIKASVGYNDINSIIDSLPYDYNRGGQQGEYVPTNNSNGNVQVTINGKIELTGQNGQSVDIMEILRTNPMFVRQITEMVVLQMNNNTHGGRNELFHNRFSH